MSDDNIVALSHTPDSQALSVNIDGTPTNIDIVTGHVFDKFGNSVGRWSPMDSTRADEHNKALARAAHRESSALSAASIRGSCVSNLGTEYVNSIANQFQALSLANAEERAQLLETGTIRRTRKIDPGVKKLVSALTVATTQEQRMQALSGVTPEQLQAVISALDVGVPDVHVESALPNFITGYKNDGFVADVYAPPLVVQHKSDYYWQYQKEDAFQRALPQLGAAGSAPFEVIPRFGNTKFTSVQRAIAAWVPTEVEANQDAPLQIKMGHQNRMIDAALLEREIRVQAVARASGNWSSATTLLSGYQWNGGASSDPVKDINNACESSYGSPNAMIIPEQIWNAMCRNPAVRSYYAYGGTSPGILTDAQMAALLKLPEIHIARAKYINSAGTLSYVWGSDVVIFRKPTAIPPVNQRDVCTAITFRWGMQSVKVPDGQTFSPDMIDGRGWIMRQFFNQIRGGLGGIQMVLCLADAEVQTSKYIGNVLINAYQ